ncbi:MAG: helix-hairpin-helix domain-containing protein [Stackebrandtia sp.]
MSISTQIPATRGTPGNEKPSKRAELTAAVRDRLGRLSGGGGGDSGPDSCFEVVDSASGRPRPSPWGAWDERPRGRLAKLFDVQGLRLLLSGRTRGVLAAVLLAVAVVAGALAWFSWPSPEQVPGAVSVAQTQDGGGVAAGRVKVSVVGDVSEPGVVEVPAGSRVDDVIEAAGGMAPESASAGYLNLARKVKDGELIVVEAEGDAKPGASENPDDSGEPGSADDPDDATDDPSGTDDAGEPGAPSGPININEATEAELETLPGIGPVTAASIVEYREQNGGFDSVEQLAEVDGIGPATLKNLSDQVTV